MVRTAYKYPRARKFFESLQSSHSVKEMHELMTVGVEFSDLGMVKIEADHPIPGVDTLIARLNQWLLSNWDVHQSPEQYIEVIGATNYIRPASMDPTTVMNVVPDPEVTEPSVMESVEPTVRATPTF